MYKLPLSAAVFAAKAHDGQTRKFTGAPYITHPAEVATIVATTPGATAEMVAAAWLHDVVEDTEVTSWMLFDEFGYNTAWLVRWVTKISKHSDGNRATRKALDRDHYALGPPASQTIKVADMISNATNLAELDPEFAKVWMPEARDLLAVLTEADEGLRARAHEILVEYFAGS